MGGEASTLQRRTIRMRAKSALPSVGAGRFTKSVEVLFVVSMTCSDIACEFFYSNMASVFNGL